MILSISISNDVFLIFWQNYFQNCRKIIDRARFGDLLLIWNSVQTQQGVPRASTALKLKIPDEYCCPISEDLFKDTVTTSDGQHYDRSAIAHWFQSRKSSPCTGLPLANTTLSTDRRMVKDVREWVNGEDLIYNEQEQPPKKKPQPPKSQPIVINFHSRQGNFKSHCFERYSLVSLV